jgi:hypothetical protein
VVPVSDVARVTPAMATPSVLPSWPDPFHHGMKWHLLIESISWGTTHATSRSGGRRGPRHRTPFLFRTPGVTRVTLYMAELGHLLEAIHDAPRATSFFGSARTAVGGTVLPALWSVAVVGQ